MLLRAVVALAICVASLSSQAEFRELTKDHVPLREDYYESLAFGDLDGDGDFDLVFAAAPSRVWLQNDQYAFEDVTETSLVGATLGMSACGLLDVDVDGDLDLVLAGRNGTELWINDGKAVFTREAGRLPGTISSAPRRVVVADLDHDRDPDFLVVGLGTRFYVNDGKGYFSDRTSVLGLPSFPFHQLDDAVVIDIERDGDLDLVVVGAGTAGERRLLRNDGSLTFRDISSTNFPATTQALSVRAGDVDGDGDVDLIFGAYANAHRLWLNDGTGRFSDATAGIPGGDRWLYGLDAADVDADGDVDLIAGDWYEPAALWRNDGTGRFAAVEGTDFVDRGRCYDLRFVDLDGDGDQDVVGAYRSNSPFNHTFFGNITIAYNDGAGTFTSGTQWPLPQTEGKHSAAAAIDLDADGDLDLVRMSSSILLRDRLSIHRNDGTGSMRETSELVIGDSYPSSMVTGDVNGDGFDDLVVTQTDGGPLRLFLGDGRGGLVLASSAFPRTTVNTGGAVLVDIDGDKDLDLAVADGVGGYSRPRVNRLYRNDGLGVYTDITTTHMPAVIESSISVAALDADNDGDVDLVFTSQYGSNQEMRLYLNDGQGSFSIDPSSFPRFPQIPVTSVSAGDLDADGDADLVLGFGGGTSIVIALNTIQSGHAVFTPTVQTAMRDAYRVRLADLDGDGDLDIAWSGGRGGFAINDGAAMFTTLGPSLALERKSTSEIVVGDLDQDGDEDLVLLGNETADVFQNLQRHIRAPYLPRLGEDHRVELLARPAVHDQVVLPLLSYVRANIDLGDLERLMLEPALLTLLDPVALPVSSGGQASIALAMPGEPAYLGHAFGLQALFIDLATAKCKLSNVLWERIEGRR
ncbi:MAG: VCBS repeat-containing protein [Planctomycetes bacterium]|nr:VCBS repeat-containing protein [Planctomycetota bacterium]